MNILSNQKALHSFNLIILLWTLFREWSAAGIIFAALLIDTILGKTSNSKVESEKKEKLPDEEPVKKIKNIEITIPSVDPMKVETYI